jgi:hypothetical protein
MEVLHGTSGISEWVSFHATSLTGPSIQVAGREICRVSDYDLHRQQVLSTFVYLTPLAAFLYTRLLQMEMLETFNN